MTNRPHRMAVAGTLLVTALSGCAADAAIPAAEAVAHYDAVVADLRQALSPAVTLADEPRGRGVKTEGGGCRYTAGFYDPVQGPGHLFDDPAWPAIRGRLNTALAAQGFDADAEPRQVEGTAALELTDQFGATLKIWEDGQADVYAARAEAAACAPAEFGLPG